MNTNLLLSYNSFLGIEEHVISLLLLIDAKIYGLISKLYALYINLASAEIFTSEVYQDVSKKVYTIIAVIALFVIAYALLQNLINPDSSAKSNKGGTQILKNFLIAIILIGLVPTIFEFLYAFQNAILTYNTIPKIFLGTTANENTQPIYYQDSSGNYIFTDDCTASTYEEALSTCEKITTQVTIDEETSILKSYGNEMAFIILNGFLNPADGLENEEVVVDSSEYFNTSTALKARGIGCLIGGGILTGGVVFLEVATSPATGFATLAAIPTTITSFGGGIVTACLGGAAVGAIVDKIGYQITYEKYSWQDAITEITYEGEFDRITSFSTAITGGQMNYIPVVSTISGLALLYMMASFCLDLGLRAGKLCFYQIFAPISLLLSVIPEQKNLLGTWIKVVLTTWLEVFVRLICVCGLAYLVSNLNNTAFQDLGYVAKAIIVMGLIMFAKQLPKLLGEITGIKSESMKLGIVSKLKEGGALAAGAIIGGGITSAARNFTHNAGKIRNKWQEDKKNGAPLKERWSNAFKGAGKMALSTSAGALSGGFRSAKGGWNAKSLSEMKEAGSKGARAAVENRTKREKYRAAHSAGKGFFDDLGRVAIGHIADTTTKVGKWAGIKNIQDLQAENQAMEEITNTRDTFDSSVEKLIQKELSKGKNNIASISLANLKRLKESLEQKRAQGTATIDDEADYNKELIKVRSKLQNHVLVSNEIWSSYDLENQAKLADIRVNAVKYKGAIRNNADLSALKEAGILGANYTDNVSVILGEQKPDGRWDDVQIIDDMNKAIKRKRGENNINIAMMNQQKSQEEGKKS